MVLADPLSHLYPPRFGDVHGDCLPASLQREVSARMARAGHAMATRAAASDVDLDEGRGHEGLDGGQLLEAPPLQAPSGNRSEGRCHYLSVIIHLSNCLSRRSRRYAEDWLMARGEGPSNVSAITATLRAPGEEYSAKCSPACHVKWYEDASPRCRLSRGKPNRPDLHREQSEMVGVTDQDRSSSPQPSSNDPRTDVSRSYFLGKSSVTMSWTPHCGAVTGRTA